MYRASAFAYQTAPFLSSRNLVPSKCAIRASQGNVQKASNPPESTGVNINKYKSQRSLMSANKLDVRAEEVNDLMVKAGKGVRNCEFSRTNFVHGQTKHRKHPIRSNLRSETHPTMPHPRISHVPNRHGILKNGKRLSKEVLPL